MASALDAAARAAGLVLDRPGEFAAPVPAETKRVLTDILGPMTKTPSPVDGPAYVPAAVDQARVFGVTLQLYQLRSPRNLGIGDLGDLIDLLPYFAEAGADFVGLNPLHALFTADPERASPFAPSDRAFLNPLIIALDRVTGFRPRMTDGRAVPDADLMVDYAAVAPLKLAILREVYAAWLEAADEVERAAHARFMVEGGEALDSFATFEALSHAMTAKGLGAGTAQWPASLKTRKASGVAAFAQEHRGEIAFHAWLQFVADRQLGEVQHAAQAAGMRVGLYLDLAVGTAPDGHATWADPELTVEGITVGAPPDLFSAEGQSWGLAPLSPAVLAERDYAPYRALLSAVMRHAGAVRIDHAMGLERLWLVPAGKSAKEGAYVRQPGLVDELVAATHKHKTLAIGEDLGIVPPGFRDRMSARRIFSMRIMMFEADAHGMIRPARYPQDALACLSTHDFAPLEAFWDGDDVSIRVSLGALSEENAAAELAFRHSLKSHLMALCGLPPRLAAEPLGEAGLVAYHRAVARTACRMMAVRLEDVLGGRRLVNLPGTDREHPNWRHTLPVTVDEITESSRLAAVLRAVAQERPR